LRNQGSERKKDLLRSHSKLRGTAEALTVGGQREKQELMMKMTCVNIEHKVCTFEGLSEMLQSNPVSVYTWEN
jgi:hypothetical protein